MGSNLAMEVQDFRTKSFKLSINIAQNEFFPFLSPSAESIIIFVKVKAMVIRGSLRPRLFDQIKKGIMHRPSYLISKRFPRSRVLVMRIKADWRMIRRTCREMINFSIRESVTPFPISKSSVKSFANKVPTKLFISPGKGVAAET